VNSEKFSVFLVSNEISLSVIVRVTGVYVYVYVIL